MNLNAFRVLTDAEVDRAEQALGLPFHPDYRAFLKSGSTVANEALSLRCVLQNLNNHSKQISSTIRQVEQSEISQEGLIGEMVKEI